MNVHPKLKQAAREMARMMESREGDQERARKFYPPGASRELSREDAIDWHVRNKSADNENPFYEQEARELLTGLHEQGWRFYESVDGALLVRGEPTTNQQGDSL